MNKYKNIISENKYIRKPLFNIYPYIAFYATRGYFLKFRCCRSVLKRKYLKPYSSIAVIDKLVINKL